jgi:hypothetical protein
MDAFTTLRRQTAAKRDAIISAARAEYADAKKRINQLRQQLGAKTEAPAIKFRRIVDVIAEVIPRNTAMTSLLIAWYNYCRCNSALGKKTTPAMTAGLEKNPLTIQDLLRAAA